LVQVALQACSNQRDATLSLGFGAAGFAMNRRVIKEGRWSGFGETPDGPVDKRVPLLAAHDSVGKLIALLANYACHCTTETGDFNQISGDWAGFAADNLEAEHPGAVALIAIGCGADANPSPRGSHEQAKMHGRTIANEVTRVLTGLASACETADSSDTASRAGLSSVGPASRAGQPPQADPANDSASANAIANSTDAPQDPSQQAAKSRPAGGTYMALITVDNCGVPLEMTEAVYARIAAKHNIP
ncbi:MAG: hypothetical protein ACK58T_06070, partial [Phycisphaerae bacterium]